MKWILILSVLHWDGLHEVSKARIPIENPNIVQCNDAGYEWSKWYLTHITDVETVTWECIKNED